MLTSNKYNTYFIKRWLCLFVFICLGFKNATYALQPFIPAENVGAQNSHTSFPAEISFFKIVSGMIDMDLSGDGKYVFCKIDKLQTHPQQIHLAAVAQNTVARNYNAVTLTALQHLTDCNTRFRVPAHYHFLFRLTPF